MDTSNSNNQQWPKIGAGVWTRWWGYLARWLVFGVVVSVFQPVADDLGNFWSQKASQGLVGLLFGFACAVVFTVCENKLNTPRVKWKTWLIVGATWFVVKAVFVTVIALN